MKREAIIPVSDGSIFEVGSLIVVNGTPCRVVLVTPTTLTLRVSWLRRVWLDVWSRCWRAKMWALITWDRVRAWWAR